MVTIKKPNQQKPVRKELILAAARDVFSRKGFKGAATAEIAAQAGVAEGTIFRYFKTKKELLLAVVEPVETAWIDEFFLSATGENGTENLRVFLKNHLGMVRENFDLFKVFFYESQFYPELREKFVENVVLKTLAPVESHLSKMISSGEYREVDVKIASRALYGMLAVFIAWKEILQAEDVCNFDDGEVIESIIDIYLHGVKAKHSLVD